MLEFTATSVGRKYLMGLSGILLAGFVFTHMAGNMLIFLGSDAYNVYAHALISNKPLILISELILILAVVTHIVTAVALTMTNKKAKGKVAGLSAQGAKGATLAARTMAPQGAIVLVFIITHLITFKYGAYYETSVNGVVMRDVARLLVETFKSWEYVAWYSLCLVLLGFHLSHGVGSIFQSLGLLHPSYQPKIKVTSLVYGLVVSVGFLSQPIFVFFAN